jgi:hypothetical protein
LYPFAIIGYVIACYLIGWLDDHHGIWKAENNYTYEVSPYSQDMLKKINDIHTVLLGDDGK